MTDLAGVKDFLRMTGMAEGAGQMPIHVVASLILMASNEFVAMSALVVANHLPQNRRLKSS